MKKMSLNRLPTGPFLTHLWHDLQQWRQTYVSIAWRQAHFRQRPSETLILQGFQTPVSRISPVLCQYTSKLPIWQVISCL